jgi:hypothetical protein
MSEHQRQMSIDINRHLRDRLNGLIIDALDTCQRAGLTPDQTEATVLAAMIHSTAAMAVIAEMTEGQLIAEYRKHHHDLQEQYRGRYRT